MEEKYNEIYEILGSKIKDVLITQFEKGNRLEELRLRAEKPLVLSAERGSFFITPGGKITNRIQEAYIVTSRDIKETLTLVSGYSIYAFEEEIKKGFITIKGGSRIGLCGKTVIEEGLVKTIKHISALNIRIAHEVLGAANHVISQLLEDQRVLNTIIVSPPKCGKTTMLRDIVRQLSNGSPTLGFGGISVAVVDERSEIAGSYMGIPQNDVGIRTDVLDCCPKALGMHMVLRSMSPECVAVDEIGLKDDVYAIEEILNSGTSLICTAHGSIAGLAQKPYIGELIKRHMFDRIIALSFSGQKRQAAVYDKNLNPIKCNNP